MRKVAAKHTQWLEKELPILENEGVINSETLRSIQGYYSKNTASGMHWAIIAFAVLGSLLIGAGIILLFAHNWDDLGRPMRTVLSFMPVVLGSLLSTLALVKNGGTALRESAGIFHSLAMGASIALIGQTYHLPSNLPGFLFTWSVLVLPLQFLLRSTGAYLIYLALISGWSMAAQTHYGQAIAFWLLLLPAIGKVAAMIKVNRHAPDTLVSILGILFGITVSMGVVFERTVPGLWIMAYSALLSTSALLGAWLYGGRSGWNNPFNLFGIIGVALLAYLLTWSDLWHDIGWNHYRTGWQYREWGLWIDGGITLALLSGWLFTVVKAIRFKWAEISTPALLPIFGTACFFITVLLGNKTNELCAIIFNAYLLVFGIMYIVLGCRNTRLRQLNGGKAILSLLFVTRFFDAAFGFLVRGMVFIVLGACFLTVNMVMAKHKKQQEVAS